MRRGPGSAGRVLAACAAALALAAAGCSSGGAASAGNTPVTGGTAVMAEAPQYTPTYIFPSARPS